MSRTTSPGIGAALTAFSSQPGYLVRVDIASGTYRLCTFDEDFVYGGFTWNAADLTLSDLRIGSVGAVGRMTVGDPAMVWWAFNLRLELVDAPVWIYQAYVEAPNEATPLWNGRIGQTRQVKPIAVECELTNDVNLTRSPRRRVQDVVNKMYLLPPGKIIPVGNTTWTVMRKLNS